MRTIRGLAWVTAGAAILAVATDAGASCTERRSMQTFQNQMPPYNYAYITAGANADTTPSTLRGRFWQLGNRSEVNEGTYPKDKWLYTSAPGINVEVRLDAPGVVGCPARGALMLTLVETTANSSASARFAAMVSPEVTTGPVNWDYGRYFGLSGTIGMADVPKPTFQESSPPTRPNAAGTVILPAIQSGVYTAGNLTVTVLSAYQLVGARIAADATADPGRNPALWSVLQTANYTGLQVSLPQTLDCSDPTQDWVLAIRLRYDGGVLGDYVGESTRVKCKLP